MKTPATRTAGALALLALTAILAVVTARLSRGDGGEGGAASRPAVMWEVPIAEITSVHVVNETDDFELRRERGDDGENDGWYLDDFPMETVNGEYILMLLDEAARVEYIERLDDAAPARYGLEPPRSRVEVRLATGKTHTLLLGGEEPAAGGVYAVDGSKPDEPVVLLDRSRTVRFTMPLKNYVDLWIVRTPPVSSPLAAVAHLRLSGSRFPSPVVIEEVRKDDETSLRAAASFGAATHLVRQGGGPWHELDQTEGLAVFASLASLPNTEVYALNAGPAELARWGFDAPLVRAEAGIRYENGGPPVPVSLRVSRAGDGLLLVRDDNASGPGRVIHRVEERAFMTTSYPRLASRWFLSPFLLDLRSLDLSFGTGKQASFVFSGETNSSFSVTLDGRPCDIERFRKFYTLLVSAQNDGSGLLETAPSGKALFTARFRYRDQTKADDTLTLYPGTLRRLAVAVNGTAEFQMLSRFLPVLEAAFDALAAGRDFAVEW